MLFLVILLVSVMSQCVVSGVILLVAVMSQCVVCGVILVAVMSQCVVCCDPPGSSDVSMCCLL